MSKLAKALTAAAGNAGGEALYVEDVFSTYLYTGNGSTQTITTGIDLDGEGGLLWIKRRSGIGTHTLVDSINNSNGRYYLATNLTNGLLDTGTSSYPLSSTGFSLNNGGTQTNRSGSTYASWTFRKAPKFFDVVTYTGDGVDGRMIDHNLESVPACIIIKSTSTATGWVVSHSSLAYDKALFLHDTAAEDTSTTYPDKTLHTSTQFNTGSNAWTNYSGRQYVAYLFASDAGGFGDDDESIIKCGSASATAGTWTDVNVGFEPQWVLIKNSTATGSYNTSGNAGSNDWYVIDSMRGATAATGSNTGTVALSANSSIAEYNDAWFGLTSTGFSFKGLFSGSDNFIYIAIRRPMKTPESGTEVFKPISYSGTGSAGRSITGVGFPPDMFITSAKEGLFGIMPNVYDRLRGGTRTLQTSSTSAEPSANNFNYTIDYDGNTIDPTYNNLNVSGKTYINWYFKRATGFFDVVAYTATQTVDALPHNLGVPPEMAIFKRRDGTTNWVTWHKDLTSNSYEVFLNSSAAEATPTSSWNNSNPASATTFTIGVNGAINTSGASMIMYLFATLAGVSKVGSYTGTGSNVDVDCGFSAGARFILIKRTDSTGDWYVWDSERGIVAGNDPYLLLNSTAAENTSTDYIDPLSSGFTVTSSAPAALNASGGNYIYLAIA